MRCQCIKLKKKSHITFADTFEKFWDSTATAFDVLAIKPLYSIFDHSNIVWNKLKFFWYIFATIFITEIYFTRAVGTIFISNCSNIVFAWCLAKIVISPDDSFAFLCFFPGSWNLFLLYPAISITVPIFHQICTFLRYHYHIRFGNFTKQILII